ncbi:MAG: peptidyl-prolyl cis-trans isomerase [Cyclonatronaceae bacterium]
MTDNRRLLLVLPLLLLMHLLPACEQLERHQDDVILAEVGNHVLRLSDIKNNIPEEVYAQDSLRAIENYKTSWINRKLKIMEAKRLGLDRNPEVQRRITRANESILVDAFNEAVYLDMNDEPVTRSEAQSYYESNKEKFILAERHVRYRHLIAATLGDAQNARNALLRGRSWDSVAEQYAIQPQQAIRRSQQFRPISAAAMNYEQINNFLQIIGVTEISPIRQIGEHYHFVQLMDSREAGGHPQVDWIIGQISEWLSLERRRKQLRSMEQSLLLQAQANNEIRIFDVHQPEQEIQIVTDSL